MASKSIVSIAVGICIVCILGIVVSLHIYRENRAADAVLDRADSLLTSGEADAAMSLLDSIRADAMRYRRSRHYRYRLLEADAMNKTYRPFTTDSILKEVARYYDGWRVTPTKRLRARYLLGCAYRDLGESPQAIMIWEDAVAAVDATSVNCDYHILSAICAQLANVYHVKQLFSLEISSLRASSDYSLLGGDTLYSIDNMRRIGSCYTLLHKDDSAEYYFREAQWLYNHHGFVQNALLSSTPLINLYLKQGRLIEAKTLMDEYESGFNEFDRNHELPPRRRQYYCYKGSYYEQLGMLDSAEYYYRKAVRNEMDYISRNPIYGGLLRVFQKQVRSDSIAKYAQLYCAVNDSSIVVSDRELTAQAVANYNYTRLQNEAILQSKRAGRLVSLLVLLVAVFVAASAIAIAIFIRYRERKRRQNIEIASLKSNLRIAKSDYAIQTQTLKQLEGLHKSSMELFLQDVKRLHQEREEDKLRLEAARNQLEKMTTAYEENFRRLSSDIENKRNRIETLEHLISKHDTGKTTNDFETSEIVGRIRILVEKHDILTKHDCHALLEAGKNHFPLLIEDLNKSNNITTRAIQVCMLLFICDRVEDIANLMGVTGSRVTNLKGDISLALFGKKDSRSLAHNLSDHYGTPIP